MATTKKVATSSVVTKKQQNAVVKNVSKIKKSGDGDKKVAPAKKNIVKAQKQKSLVSKVAITNNTLSLNKKKISKIDKKEIDSKLKVIEKLQSSKSKTKPKESIISRFAKRKPSVELALLSPYRYPLNIERLAVQTARLGGVFFVVIGALFTMFYASHTFSTSTALQASLSNSLSASDTLNPVTQTVTPPNQQGSATAINCSDPLLYESTSCASSVNKKPSASFDLARNSELQGNIRVRIKVDHATRISLQTFFKTANSELTIGSMNKVSDDTWELYWDTTKFEDGNYKLKALITNVYGSYEVLDSAYSLVENAPLPLPTTSVPTTDSSLNTQQATSTKVVEEVDSDAHVLSVDAENSSNEFRFEIESDEATKVKMIVHASGDSKNTILGYAYKTKSSLWKYRWNSGLFAPGTYVVTALVLTSSGEETTNSVTVRKTGNETILKTEATSSLSVQTAPVTQAPLAPEIDVVIEARSPVSGTVGVKIDVAYAALVELYAQAKSGLQKRFVGKIGRAHV